MLCLCSAHLKKKKSLETSWFFFFSPTEVACLSIWSSPNNWVGLDAEQDGCYKCHRVLERRMHKATQQKLKITHWAPERHVAEHLWWTVNCMLTTHLKFENNQNRSPQCFGKMWIQRLPGSNRLAQHGILDLVCNTPLTGTKSTTVANTQSSSL